MDIKNAQTLARSWQQQRQQKDPIDPELIFALLAIVKSKPYWKQVMTDSPPQREALSLEIARKFYTQQDNDRCITPSLSLQSK